jgi:hypothetical protein
MNPMPASENNLMIMIEEMVLDRTNLKEKKKTWSRD